LARYLLSKVEGEITFKEGDNHYNSENAGTRQEGAGSSMSLTILKHGISKRDTTERGPQSVTRKGFVKVLRQ